MMVKASMSPVLTEHCPVETLGVNAVTGVVRGTWMHQAGAAQPDLGMGVGVVKYSGEEMLLKLVAGG